LPLNPALLLELDTVLFINDCQLFKSLAKLADHVHFMTLQALQTQPQITSLILNIVNCKIGMTIDKEKMHNQISIMYVHAQNMQKSVLEKNRYADLSTRVHPRSGLEQPRCAAGQSRTMAACCQRSWNNILAGIFLPVLKLFQSWNNIPRLSTDDGIMVFQLFQEASTRLFQYRGIFQRYSSLKKCPESSQLNALKNYRCELHRDHPNLAPCSKSCPEFNRQAGMGNTLRVNSVIFITN
jgi:hypothetical protein